MTEQSVEPLSHEQVLLDAIQMRENEILSYQININNYTAILEMEDDEDDPDLAEEMASFRQRISDLLKSEKREQKKSKMVLAALRAQLEALQNKRADP